MLLPTTKYVALQIFTAMVAVWMLLQTAQFYSGIQAEHLLMAGIALSSFGTACLTIYGQYQLNKVKKTGEATHTLSNSAMGVQLQNKLDITKKLSVLAHRLAEYTKQPEAEAAAIAADLDVEKARRDLQDHLIKQAKVDAVSEL